tara:strand:- start:2808 stop:2960 length:153 start_codon:yes stop_codon:yes gene_type:complete
MAEEENQIYIGDLIPSLANYQRIINRYNKAINNGEFYEEPIGDDYSYPDW